MCGQRSVGGNRVASPHTEHVAQEAVPTSESVKEAISLTSESVTDVRYPLAQMILPGGSMLPHLAG